MEPTNCKQCARFDDCKDSEGKTKYWTDHLYSGNVADLCDNFVKDNLEVKEKITTQSLLARSENIVLKLADVIIKLNNIGESIGISFTDKATAATQHNYSDDLCGYISAVEDSIVKLTSMIENIEEVIG